MSAGENQTVFLSYASQDAEAAKRICEALRAAGVEVWLARLRRAVSSFEFRVLSWESGSCFGWGNRHSPIGNPQS
jgi:hypothetical protein